MGIPSASTRGGQMKVSKVIGVAVATLWAGLLGAPVPAASAQPCSDVEVIFARGTGEPPGSAAWGRRLSTRCGRMRAVSRSRCTRSTTPRAATSTTPRRSLKPSSTESGTRAPTCRPRRQRAPIPGSCSAATRRAPRWRDSSPRPRCRRASLRLSFHSRCRSRSPTMSRRSLCSVSRRRRGRASTARRRSRSDPPMRRRRSSCALKATRSATAHRVVARASRTPSTR